MTTPDDQLGPKEPGDILFPWPRLMRTPLAVLYMGGISEKSPRRIASEHGMALRRTADHPGIVLWARKDLDCLLEKFEPGTPGEARRRRLLTNNRYHQRLTFGGTELEGSTRAIETG